MLCLLASAALAALSFLRLDIPIARHFWDASRFLEPLGRGLASRFILSGEAVVLLTLVLARLARGRSSPFATAVAIGCLVSMSAYVINDHVLKVIFAVPGPVAVLQGARHSFNLFEGSEGGSFPSGHMVLAAAFAGVLMRLCRPSFWPLCALLLLAAALLVVGEWHFLSDVIAGAFLGLSAGFLSGEAWAAHSLRRR